MRSLFPLFCWLVTVTTAAAQTDTLPTAGEEWRERWRHSLEYTLEALDSLEEEELAFRPTEGQMTLHAQFRHLAGNIFGLSERYLDHAPDNFNATATRSRLTDETLTKARLAGLLRDAYAFGAAAAARIFPDRLDERVDFFAGPKSRRQIVYLLQDHATHHRAQVLVYLRLLGHQPPRYRGW